MRNLKKFLALVLAMVMTFSLMLSASAANGDYAKYTDKENITDEFKEAVQVLSGLDILKGDGPDDAKTFRPSDTITRAEAAAIIYRVATRDTADAQVQIYKDYATFTDVNSEDWFAGYVGYCQNAGYIKGKSPTRFAPYETVTGYEMLTMLLRVVGYGQENEFVGGDWQVKVAARSKELHITDNVRNANFETTLNYAARRDVVADLTFQTLVTVPTVEHNALGYSDRISLTSEFKNPTLGQKNFGLFCDRGWKVVDAWGTPGYDWYRGGEQMYANATGTDYAYDDNRMPVYGPKGPYNPGSLGLIDTGKYAKVATVTAEPTKIYNTANVHECDVAHDLEFEEDETFDLYVNNKARTTDKYRVEATDTVTRVGGQGRVTKFWYGVTSRFAGDMRNWCTMVDTYLAKVTKVSDVVLDPAGHIIKNAELTLDVYDDGGTRTYNTADSTRGNDYGDPSEHVATKKTNWEYSVGDFVLIQGYTDYTHDYDNYGSKTAYDAAIATLGGTPTAAQITATANRSGLNHKLGLDPQAEIEKTAFETNTLLPKSTTNDANIKVLHKVEPVLAKQTTTYWNAGKHQVGGEDKPDALTLYMDYAGTSTNTTFAWYYDDNGNIIGIGPVPNTVNYGVITSLWSSFAQGDASTTGNAVTMATVKYANGETETLTIDKFFVSSDGTPGNGHKEATTSSFADMLVNDDSMELIPVYDYNVGADTMEAGNQLVGYAAPNTSLIGIRANNGYQLSVAPVASVNASVESAYTDKASGKYFGIIKEQLFKFVTSEDGVVTAIEVAGNGNGINTASPDVMYVGHHNALASATAGENVLYKNYAYVTNNGSAAGGAITWMNSDTMVVVKNSVTGSIDTYTLSTLPGNVDIDEESEIDWVDANGDSRAEVVYVKGRIEGTITYGLFYYNGGAAQWNGTTGTLTGWLNGNAETITFANEAQFRTVRDSQNYAAHIFALQLTNGIVSDVMQGDNNMTSTWNQWLLYKSDAVATGNQTFAAIVDDIGSTTNIKGVVDPTQDFKLGTEDTKYNNPYTTKTQILYVRDGDGTGNTSVVTYNKDRQSVTAGGYEFHLNPSSKIVGIGMGVTGGDAILEYLDHTDANDVTIVFENNQIWSIVEIYVATDPDVTPSGNQVANPYNNLKVAARYEDGGASIRFNVQNNNTTGSSLGYTLKVFQYSPVLGVSSATQIGGNYTGSLAASGTDTDKAMIWNASNQFVYFAELYDADGNFLMVTSYLPGQVN